MGAYFEEKRSGPAQVCDVIKEAEAPKDPGWSNKGGETAGILGQYDRGSAQDVGYDRPGIPLLGRR
jgi:hypothetical protein